MATMTAPVFTFTTMTTEEILEESKKYLVWCDNGPDPHNAFTYCVEKGINIMTMNRIFAISVIAVAQ